MKQLKNAGFELKRQIKLHTEANESRLDQTEKQNNRSPIQIWRN